MTSLDLKSRVLFKCQIFDIGNTISNQILGEGGGRDTEVTNT